MTTHTEPAEGTTHSTQLDRAIARAERWLASARRTGPGSSPATVAASQSGGIAVVAALLDAICDAFYAAAGGAPGDELEGLRAEVRSVEQAAAEQGRPLPPLDHAKPEHLVGDDRAVVTVTQPTAPE